MRSAEADWRSMRSASVLTPRSARNESNGPGIAPTAFCRKAMRSRSAACLAHHHDAAHHVRVAVEVFGGRVHDQIEAVFERPLRPGTGEGVVAGGEDALGARHARQCARGRRSSAVGLVGVSTQIRRVSGRIAASSASASERSTKVASMPAERRRTLSNKPPRAAVEVVADDDVGPLSRQSSTVAVAAMPEAKAKPAVPPSRSATQRSNAMRVGFCVRAYSKPLCTPGLDCA